MDIFIVYNFKNNVSKIGGFFYAYFKIKNNNLGYLSYGLCTMFVYKSSSIVLTLIYELFLTKLVILLYIA